jgi:hypothetical protein
MRLLSLLALCLSGVLLACAGRAGAQNNAPAPLAVDAGGFPTIRIYLTPGSTPPVTLAENGRSVPFRLLTGPGDRAPLRTALVLDTSGSMQATLAEVQAAALAFVRRVRTGDRIALVRFASTVEVLTPATSDSALLTQRIAGLKADGATALYDAIATGLRLARAESGGGLRAVVLLTDGKDEGEGPQGTPGSAVRLVPLKALLAESGVPLFALGLGKDVDRGVLQELAAASGGRAFFADRSGDVEILLDSVAGTLLEARGLSYISPTPAPDGTRREISGAGSEPPGGEPASNAAANVLWRVAYVAPKEDAIIWRWPVSAPTGGAGMRRRSACGVGAMSPAGTWALAFGPATLLRGDGTPAGMAAQGPAFRPERARVLEDGTGLLFGGTDSTLLALNERSGALEVPAETPRRWVALSPGGAAALRLTAQPGNAPPRIEAVHAVTDSVLWSVTCPGTTCDRLAGAAISDDGAAVFNQTGALYRVSETGALSRARPEVFFGPVSLSADGRRAAAVVWQGARGSGAAEGPRALLLDETLRTVETLPVQSGDADLPPIAALSPGGAFLAVLDDVQLRGVDLTVPSAGGPRPWRRLARPAPTPAPCDRTVEVDNAGHVLVSDGESLTLLRGFQGP